MLKAVPAARVVWAMIKGGCDGGGMFSRSPPRTICDHGRAREVVDVAEEHFSKD